MKKRDIKLGVRYHNGKQGRWYGEREIIDEGAHCRLYPGVEPEDCIRYRVKRGLNLGGEGNMTRTAFARWAAGEVSR